MPESRWERARHSPHVPPGPNASSWNDTTTGHHVDPYALTEGSSTYEGDTGRSTPPGGGRRTRRDPGTEPGHLAASYDHLSAYPGAPFDSHPGAPFDAHPGGPSDSYRGGPADSYRGSPQTPTAARRQTPTAGRRSTPTPARRQIRTPPPRQIRTRPLRRIRTPPRRSTHSAIPAGFRSPLASRRPGDAGEAPNQEKPRPIPSRSAIDDRDTPRPTMRRSRGPPAGDAQRVGTAATVRSTTRASTVEPTSSSTGPTPSRTAPISTTTPTTTWKT